MMHLGAFITFPASTNTHTVRHTNTTSAHLNLLYDSAQIIQAIHLSPGQHTGAREEL